MDTALEDVQKVELPNVGRHRYSVHAPIARAHADGRQIALLRFETRLHSEFDTLGHTHQQVPNTRRAETALPNRSNPVQCEIPRLKGAF